MRPTSKFDLIFGNSSYVVYDIWVVESGFVTLSVDLQIPENDFLYIFAGTDIDDFEDGKKPLHHSTTTEEWQTSHSNWKLGSGLNKLYITQAMNTVKIGNINITSSNAAFYKKKGIPK
eukprot:Awhi_evm1s4340